MKRGLISVTLICLVMLVQGGVVQAQGLSAEQLADHGVPAGAAREVLPAMGALVHVQFNDLLSVVEAVEDILVAGIPDKAVPPDLQQILQTEHPLLLLLGMQAFQQPLTPELLEQATGINTRGAIGLTLYFGDPRRMFVLSIPTGNRQALAPLLSAALMPWDIEEVNVNGGKAIRMVSNRLVFAPELYLVSSADTLYLCGDLNLVQALYETPTAQRFGQDSFFSRALPATETMQMRLVVNPAMAKPMGMQLKGLSMMAKAMIPAQRAALMERIPAEAKQQIEMQMRMQLGVRDMDQLADYLECIVVATLDQLIDGISGRMVAFEGFTMAASLDGDLVQFNAALNSGRFKDKKRAAALPMDQVKRALSWLGPDYQSFTAAGREPQPEASPMLSAWAKRVQQQCQAKGVDWPGFARFVKMLDDLKPIPTVESRAPWTLSVNAPLHPAPSMEDAESLEDYLYSLELPVHRQVSITPDQGRDFVANCYREEMQALNQNRELGQEFGNSIQKQRPLFLQQNRFEAASLDGGVTRYARESVWTTQGGIFGYDQHELVNRKVTYARRVGDYLVYHRGAKASSWLAGLQPAQSQAIAPGVANLLARVPEGANYVSVQRVMRHLPRFIDGIASLESRLHADAQAYLAKAQAAVDSSDSMEAAKHAVSGMKMPLIIGSVCINPETRKVYALLPAGNLPLMFPRPKVAPLLQKVFEDYAAEADKVGGGLVYTKTSDESCQIAVLQSTSGFTTLTKTVGNALFENYFAGPQQMAQLQQGIMTQRDGDPSAFSEVIVRNPQWQFLPQPRAKVPAEPGAPIPPRSYDAGKSMIDLSEFYNASLDDTWHKGGLANNTLKDLPRGVQTFDGVSFDVRGIVQLSGGQAKQELIVEFPEAVTYIEVLQKCKKVHFLHGCAWQSFEGTPVGKYVVNYENGDVRFIPIVYGKDVQDWWLSEEFAGPNIVWKGTNHASPDGPPVGIFKTTWENPSPDAVIDNIDYVSTMDNSAPFLIAITVE